MNKIMYSAKEAQALAATEPVLFIDVRDSEEFAKEHLPNAVNIPEIFTFLATSSKSGLEELQKKFSAMLGAAGLKPDMTAIFYEDSLNTRFGGSCRGYWLLKYLGHSKVGILDGGLWAWKSQNLPLTTEKMIPQQCDFQAHINPSIMATQDDVLQALQTKHIVLLDCRDEAEWLGESSSPYGVDFAPRKGHLPGAKWILWHELMEGKKDNTHFKTANEIKDICAKQDISPDDEIIIYCFKGARAANMFAAMEQADFKHLKVYFGSWNEWARDPNLPIETNVP